MKKTTKKLLILSSALTFSLCGCGSTSNDLTYKLSATCAKSSFDQYEKFLYSDLNVSALGYDKNNELVETKEVTEFQVYESETNTLIEDNSMFPFYGDEVNLVIKSDGYIETTLTISVLKAKGYTQKLIVSEPTKINYHKGDKPSLDGINVRLETKYYTGLNDYKEKADYLTDDEYKIDINGNEDVENFVFDGYGTYCLNVSVESYTTSGVKYDLTTTIYLYSTHESISSVPVDYSSTNLDTDWEEDNREVTIKISNPNKTLESGDKGYYSPDEINTPKNIFDYGQNNAQYWQYSPATGDIPFLIIPVVIPDYSGNESPVYNTKLATNELWEKINDAFFASSTDVPFESLRSYYSKSSGGQANIVGTVTDYYYPAVESKTFNTYYSFTSAQMDRNAFIDEALSWAKETYNLDLSKYDSDKNGSIDGAWFVAVNAKRDTSVMSFWGFSSSTEEVGTTENPLINNYGWLCSDFLVNSTGEDAELDPHVIIHESGHMFGLNDYYSYNQTGSDIYSPLGRADMMDNNCSDQNSFSKLLMGYQKPYVVYGDATITLKADQNLNQCILIPYDSKDYSSEKYKDENGKVNINLFDEYLLLDFYTDKNLNAQDYESYNVKTIKGYGVRAYHVDNRLQKVLVNYKDGNYECQEIDPDEALAALSDGKNTLIKAISNNEDGSRAEKARFGLSSAANKYDEIRLISSNNTFVSTKNYARNEYLFASNGDVNKNAKFTFSEYASQFNNGKFNSNEDFNYTFEVLGYKD